MLNKVITTAMTILAICLTAEAIRQAWEEEKENK